MALPIGDFGRVRIGLGRENLLIGLWRPCLEPGQIGVLARAVQRPVRPIELRIFEGPGMFRRPMRGAGKLAPSDKPGAHAAIGHPLRHRGFAPGQGDALGPDPMCRHVEPGE